MLSSSPALGNVPPGDEDGDGAGLDGLEDGDGLGVRHALDRHPVNRQNLVTLKISIKINNLVQH